ncbi:hypothetical protein X975_03435, partial [Stegodyphus mimosarum]
MTTKVITTTTKRPRSTPHNPVHLPVHPTLFIPSQPCPSIPETTTNWPHIGRRFPRPPSSPCPNIPETTNVRTRPKRPCTRPTSPLCPETTTTSTRIHVNHPSLIPNIYSSRLKFFKPFHFATDYTRIYG